MPRRSLVTPYAAGMTRRELNSSGVILGCQSHPEGKGNYDVRSKKSNCNAMHLTCGKLCKSMEESILLTNGKRSYLAMTEKHLDHNVSIAISPRHQEKNVIISLILAYNT